MRMLIAGKRRGGKKKVDVINPYTGRPFANVPVASPKDIEDALAGAERGFREISSWSALRRSEALYKASELVARDEAELSLLLTREVGKTLAESRAEVKRCGQVLRLSAEEAKRLHGETVPFDAAPGAADRRGFFLREPLGIVVAISPFNFPLNLSAHKLAPALAAGNAVILKPASATPLAALRLGEILVEAGLPPLAISVITGPGGVVGEALVSDRRVRMVTFTGSHGVGKRIIAKAGLKKTAMELGSNSAVVVMDDASLDKAVPGVVRGAYALAGQVCISVQRVFVQEDLYDEFVCRALEEVKDIRVGDPEKEGTRLGPMIDAAAATKARRWVEEAVRQGAVASPGLELDGNRFQPLFLSGIKPKMKVFSEEAFAPLFTVMSFGEEDVAYGLVNMSRYGLQAGVFTSDIGRAWRAVERIDCGGVIINDVPTFRVDLMPYGGMKDSGLGREGPRFAIEEMTDIKLVCFNNSR